MSVKKIKTMMNVEDTKMKKTFNVKALKDDINISLKMSEYVTPDYRQGLISCIENILHRTGNYSGFRYLSKDEVPDGEQPGININVITNLPFESMDMKFSNTDETRRYYF